MQEWRFWSRVGIWMWAGIWLVMAEAAVSVFALPPPIITSIRLVGTDLEVQADIPAGITKVTLQSRPQLGGGAWEPRAVQRLSGNGGLVRFVLPRSTGLEVLRVQADPTEPLPAFFYRGTNSFVGAPDTTDPSGGLNVNAVDVWASTVPVAVPRTDTAAMTQTREVVESDIWKISGQRLFFFNQYRGLQIINLSQPAQPVVEGTFDLPAAGEQMYVLNADYVVLLARDGCSWYASNGTESRVLVVKVTGPKPTLVASLPVNGYIQESRMVGTALYVATGAYQPAPLDPAGAWEWGSQVCAFDLAQPETPVVREKLWYSGNGNVVTATDRFLFVAMTNPQDWRQSSIQCLDISAANGTMQALSTLVPAGQVKDKFKMSLRGEILTVISERWGLDNRLVTLLETFSLTNPAAPVKLSNPGLELGAGEQLHATRFDGDRVYVVTFLRTDPLWVVDLSDPAKPAIFGKLLVPGWSTYIQPLGDRLVTIGMDNSNSWRVAVSLFNVHDPANPTLVSKVSLGDNWSWSEATYDEKAFNVLPEAGLILVPYQASFTNGYASKVQLIDLDLTDLGPNALTARGVIDHQFQPRRATLYGDTLLSISGQELLSLAAADRDHPVVQATVELAWTVNRVFHQGEFLLELSQGTVPGTDPDPPPKLRVTSLADPQTVLGEMIFSNRWPVVGTSLKDGFLYVAQVRSDSGPYILPVKINGTNDPATPSNTVPLAFSVLDVTRLPEVTQAGHQEIHVDSFGYSAAFQAVWPKPGLLVWAGAAGYYSPTYYYYGAPGVLNVVGISSGIALMPYYWRPNQTQRLLAFDVANPSAPVFRSEVQCAGTNRWWQFSSSFTTNGLVYFSHLASEFVEGYLPPYLLNPIIVYDTTSGQYVTNLPPTGSWVQRYYLDVVDYADPKLPVARKSINLPGGLQGIAYGGALLYTTGYHWSTQGVTDGAEWMDASAYDGVSVTLVDSLALPKDWPHPYLVGGNTVWIGRPDTTTNKLSSLETWTVAETGKFTRLGAFFQPDPASSLARLGDLLVAGSDYGVYRLFNPADPARLVLVGQGKVSGCSWADLTQADAALNLGLWLPLGDYGVGFIPVRTTSTQH